MRLLPKTWPALAVSTLAHCALAGVVAGHGFPAGRSRPPATVPVELVISETPAPVEIQEDEQRVEAIRSEAKAHATPPHHHGYPVPADHDATPHDSKLVHAPIHGLDPEAQPSPPPVAESPREPPVFVLGPSSALVTRGAAHAGHEHGSPPSPGTEVLGERDVSVRAQLLTRGALRYPADARRSEIEADVPVEIVVDETGRVIVARALERPGYGLDAAAVESVQTYRFTAARRDGRPVRVRMRWVVQFRLD